MEEAKVGTAFGGREGRQKVLWIGQAKNRARKSEKRIESSS